MIYTEKIRKAIKFAAKTHNQYQQQTRKGKIIPYITHPLTVGIILSQAGASEDVIVAGILHDTIEDSTEEKKVSFEMLRERFGEKVAEGVLSVTENDKSLPWEERKKEALGHIEKFSQDALLVKSADIIANVSELLDDYNRYQEKVFSRFNASKVKIIKHQIEAIGLILQKWPGNPLAEDLISLASQLQMIGATKFMSQNPAKVIEYKKYNENIELECPICHWKGTPKKSGVIESGDYCLDVSCPICGKMLLVADFPKA
ncbi:MAG TPA: HD domain-containing protein [Candidatus Moranbacteria bacterium]|nr:HD domain-containing protein [Candidatus Moranbacteria bacterium]